MQRENCNLSFVPWKPQPLSFSFCLHFPSCSISRSASLCFCKQGLVWFSVQYVLVSSTGVYKSWVRGRRDEKPFFFVGLNTCGSSACNKLHFTLLAPRIFRWLLGFWNVYASSDLESIFLTLLRLIIYHAV
jgi:hypothetical protein